MLGRLGSVAIEFGNAEFVQHLEPLFGRRWLFQGATQVCHGRLWSALRERALCRLPKRRDDEPIVVRKRLREVGRGLLGKRSGFEQDFGRASVPSYSLGRAHVLEDGGANDWMDEFGGVFRGREIRANKRARRTEGRCRVEAGQLGDERKGRPIAENRSCPQQLRSILRQTGE